MSKRAATVEPAPVVDDSPPAGKSETLPDEEPNDEWDEIFPTEKLPPGPSMEYAPPAAPLEENGRIVRRLPLRRGPGRFPMLGRYVVVDRRAGDVEAVAGACLDSAQRNCVRRRCPMCERCHLQREVSHETAPDASMGPPGKACVSERQEGNPSETRLTRAEHAP